MYIPWWLIVIAGIIGLIAYSRHNQKKLLALENEPMTPDEMWRSAEFWKKSVLEESPILKNHLQEEVDMVNAMEIDMKRLRQRFLHDAKKQEEIARDWMNFAEAVKEMKYASEMLAVDDDDNAFDKHEERTRDAVITILEVGKRVADALGVESQSKVVIDRKKKKAEVISNMSGADIVREAVQQSKKESNS